MRRSNAWAPKGKTPIVETSSTRAKNHTILGAISYYGVVNISLRKPNRPQIKKKEIKE
ncbi:hypothetical protein BJ944DRAFT_165755 [Cunninghamella echinulata]|nr:hypothetical protein BJ944DRAFT_165755 [Cunninghamella echinulata]